MNRWLRALADWLEDRTGFRAIRGYMFDEPLPPGTGWWFTLGSVLLFGLAVQVITGIALALYYAPTPDHAWDSVRFISTMLRGGHFLRGLHHWGASLVVVVAVLHLLRVVFFGSYRKPRELNWVIGLALLLIILAFGLTGYLLPWDQRAYWATVVTINISRLTPLLGEWVGDWMRGGPEIGALTLTRWYSVHVLVLPVLLAMLVIAHLYLMRRHGISGPIRERPGERRPFFPYQAARDLTMASLAGVVLAFLAWKGAPALESPADPTSSDYVPRPDWYFFGLFQLLKYFPGRWEVVGALVLPGLAFLFLFLLPWIDRGRSREWASRRWLLGLVVAGFAGVVTLTVLGGLDHPTRASEAWNVRELAGAALITSGDQCTRCHRPEGVAAAIEPGRIGRTQDWLAQHVADPEMIAPGLREPPPGNDEDTAAIVAALARMRTGPPPSIDASTQSILVLVNRTCLHCHRIDGVGGDDGPDLSHAGKDHDAASIEKRIIDPKSVKPDAEMKPLGDKLKPEEIHAIAQWVASHK